MGREGQQAGQATVELALVLPVVVLLALVVAQAAVVGHHQVLVVHAARGAARAAAVAPEVGAAREAARAATGLDPGRLEVRLGGGRRPGERVTAVVRYRAPTTVPVVGALLGDVTLSAEVTARIE
jgi:hypothetical protein